MDGALKEVTKYLRVKHNDWPLGYDIEIAFAGGADAIFLPSKNEIFIYLVFQKIKQLSMSTLKFLNFT